MLSCFKLGLYSLAFIIGGLETVLNASQEGYIYGEVLEGFFSATLRSLGYSRPLLIA